MEADLSGDAKANEPPLLLQRDGAVETLSINDAPRNRMSLEFMDALEAEIDRVATDSSVRALVIRGAGEENFSVGMDLKQLPQGIARMGSVRPPDSAGDSAKSISAPCPPGAAARD